MSEIAILHVCLHCDRVFSSPSVCSSGVPTVPTPMKIADGQWRKIQEQEGHDGA